MSSCLRPLLGVSPKNRLVGPQNSPGVRCRICCVKGQKKLDPRVLLVSKLDLSQKYSAHSVVTMVPGVDNDSGDVWRLSDKTSGLDFGQVLEVELDRKRLRRKLRLVVEQDLKREVDGQGRFVLSPDDGVAFADLSTIERSLTEVVGSNPGCFFNLIVVDKPKSITVHGFFS